MKNLKSTIAQDKENAELLLEMKNQIVTSTQTNKTKINQKFDARASLRRDNFTFSPKNSNQLFPATSVATDENSKYKITTEEFWAPDEKGSCSEPKTKESKFKKGLALTEIITRFTGGDDFIIEHCEGICGVESDTLISKLKVKSTRGGSFKILQSNNRCHYQVGKA